MELVVRLGNSALAQIGVLTLNICFDFKFKQVIIIMIIIKTLRGKIVR